MPVANFDSGTITGVSIDSSPLGGVTPAAGAFTTIIASNTAVVPTVAKTDNSTNVANTSWIRQSLYYVTPQMFGATGVDGTDDTAAVQAAVNYAITHDVVLRIPSGKYYLTDTITVAGQIKMYGARCETITKTVTSGFATPGQGAWFHLAHDGIGFIFTLPSNPEVGKTRTFGSVCHNIGTYRNQNASAPNWSPKDFGFDFSVQNAEVDFIITFLNATRGLDLNHGDKCYLRSVTGMPLLLGIRALNSYDIIQGDKVFFWPWASFDPNITAYVLANGVGLLTGRADGINIKHFFAFNMNVCWQVTHYTGDLQPADPTGSTALGRIEVLYSDGCKNAILVDDTVGTYYATLSVGQLAHIGPTNFFFKGATASGSTTVSSISSTAGLKVGLGISGAGIPNGTTISSVGTSTIVISAAATASASAVQMMTNTGISRCIYVQGDNTTIDISDFYSDYSGAEHALISGTYSAIRILRVTRGIWNITGGTYNGFTASGTGSFIRVMDDGASSILYKTYRPVPSMYGTASGLDKATAAVTTGTIDGTTIGITTASAGKFTTLGAAGAITGSTTVATGGYTVSALPAASASLRGARAYVTDATSPTFLGPLTGGGSMVVPVFCNGSAWVAG